jgi:NAD-dependent SIR2 family protein deacetylase
VSPIPTERQLKALKCATIVANMAHARQRYAAADRLASFLEEAGRVAIVTGAGVSTASGIPGYRDRDGNWKHAKPVQFADFLGSKRTRQRYWARSFAGWQRMSGAAPNTAHRALAGLEDSGFIDTLVTQNVDGLHHRAGSQKVVDLHGRIDTVVCLECESSMPRASWQAALQSANPNWQAGIASILPDGDADLGTVDSDGFSVPGCHACDGVMKPDVVFFGEAVPRDRVRQASEAVSRSRGLLVVGSSLMVFSGFRFARQALEKRKPIAILNQGRTRADDIASLKLDADCGDTLEKTLQKLMQ